MTRGARLPVAWAATALAAVLIGAIWAPYGFSMGGLIEEWDMKFLFESGRMGWTAFPGQPMGDLFGVRPLIPVPYVLAHVLDPDLFLGFHLLLIVACAAKVITGVGIGWWLFRDGTIALSLGALALVFPADTQQIALRNVHINLAVALMLAASLLAVRSLYEVDPRSRRILIAAGLLAGVIGCGIYEPVFPLYSLVPLLLFARLGVARTWKLFERRHFVALAWLAGVCTSGAYLFFAIAIQRSAYQVSLAGGQSGGIFKSALGNAEALWDSAAYRVFYDGWKMAWEVATERFSHWAYLPGALAVIFSLLMLANLRVKRSRLSPTVIVRGVIAGALALIAGYTPILVSVSHIAITQRTFLGATPGAAILAGSVLACFALASRGVMTMLAALAISLGLGFQLYQHDLYMRAYTDIAAPYLKDVANKSDPTKRVHLVMDESGVGGYLGGVYISKLMYGVPFLRSAYDDIYVLCKKQPLNASMPFSTCHREGDRWIVESARGESQSFSASGVDVIQELSVLPEHLRSNQTGTHVYSPFYPSRLPSDQYDCSADSMWGFSRFCVGEGWSDGVPYRAGKLRFSAFNAIEPAPTLFIQLAPVEASYVLRILLAHPVPKELENSWGVEINGSPVEMHARAATFYEGQITPSLLKSGENVLRFRNALDERSQVALVIRQVSLAPDGATTLSKYPSQAMLEPGVSYKSTDANMSSALAKGFSVAEPNGTWTDGNRAVMMFATIVPNGRATLEISAVPFVTEKHPSMQVEVQVDGRVVRQFNFNLTERPNPLRIPLPESSVREGKLIEVQLLIKDPASPAEVGAGNRFLGLFVQEARIVD